MTGNDETRKLVRERANYLCEYCHSLEEASAAQFAIDHIIPQSLGGSDDPANLALACQRCNGYRYNFTTGIDPQTQEIIPLFNPRKQKMMNVTMKALSLKCVVCGCGVVGIHLMKTREDEAVG